MAANLPHAKLNSSDDQELLDAEVNVLNNIHSFVNTMCLKCALELDIPDIIHKHGKPMTLSELTEALSINKAKSPYVDHLMRVLVHAKLFTKVKVSEDQAADGEGNEGFILMPAYSHFLTSDGDFSITSFAPTMLDNDFINPWRTMSRWFQDDHPTPFWTCHGRTFWDHFRLNPRLNRLFNEGTMASDSRLVGRIVPKNCKRVFEGLETMVDVGGGTGYMAKVIGDEFPGLKCIVLDRPHVVDGLIGNDKLTFIAGDMFEYIPPCDAVFLKWILHTLSDEDCLKILNKCKEAVHGSKGKRGKVILVEMVVGSSAEQEDHKTVLETQLFFDMLMMVMQCGKERTEKEWAKLFSDAGFKSYKITPVLGLKSVIEVFP